MFRSYKLIPAVWHKEALEFEWDQERGELRGKSADQIQTLIASAINSGDAIGHPYPTSFPISNPLHNIGEMAVILGTYWKLSPDLLEAYPEIPEDDETPTISDERGDHQLGSIIN